MTQNALVISRWYVVTAIPDHLSTIGLNILQRKARHIGELVKSAQKFVGDTSLLRVADIGGILFVRVRLGGSMHDVESEQATACVSLVTPRNLSATVKLPNKVFRFGWG